VWTGIIEGDLAEIEVTGASPRDRLSIDCAYQHNLPRVLSVTDPNDIHLLYEFDNDPALIAAARAVAKIGFMTEKGPASCTGFLVSASLLVTNNHCINSTQRCDTAIVIFGYEQARDGTISAAEQADCLQFISVDANKFDVAVLRVSGAPGQRWGTLTFSTRAIGQEQVLVVEHPGGEPKSVSKKDCVVKTPAPIQAGRAGAEFGHLCDVMDGSSGSPILDHDYRVVGVHHLGFEKRGRWAAENRAVVPQVLSSVLQLLDPQ